MQAKAKPRSDYYGPRLSLKDKWAYAKQNPTTYKTAVNKKGEAKFDTKKVMAIGN
jgi:hypothetical protein